MWRSEYNPVPRRVNRRPAIHDQQLCLAASPSISCSRHRRRRRRSGPRWNPPPRWPEVQYDLIRAPSSRMACSAAGANDPYLGHGRHGCCRYGATSVAEARKFLRRLAFEMRRRAGCIFAPARNTPSRPMALAPASPSRSNVEPVLWLHKITTALARGWYTEQFATNLMSRMGPLSSSGGTHRRRAKCTNLMDGFS